MSRSRLSLVLLTSVLCNQPLPLGKDSRTSPTAQIWEIPSLNFAATSHQDCMFEQVFSLESRGFVLQRIGVASFLSLGAH